MSVIDVVVYFMIVVLIPAVLWLGRKSLELWLVERYANRYSKKIILDAKIWKCKATDYEIGFKLRNNLDRMLYLRGITAVRPKESYLAWFTHESETMPNISHLDSDGITDFHNAKLDVEPGATATVSMAIRVPKDTDDSFTVAIKYFISGKQKPIRLKHQFSLVHAEIPASVSSAKTG